jgi:outer membrane biosynthesis protein TonB
MTPQQKPRPADKDRNYVVPAVAALVLLAGGYAVFRVVTGDSPRKRVMDTVAIKLVQPPPPPKVEPPPPPPKMVEEQKIEQPVDKPEGPKDEPPPGPLALDAKGGAGSDAFGLGGKAGGADFLGSGGGGTRFGHYSNLMMDRITQSLHDDEKLNAEKFRVTLKVWLSDLGKIQRVQVLHTSGDSSTDSRIEQVIGAMPALPEAPPKDMPQPIVVRIGARAGLG